MSNLVVVGAAHTDRIARLTSPARFNRTNPSKMLEQPGGVAANIALALRASEANLRLDFIGAMAEADDKPAKWLQSARIDAEFVRVDAASPTYTAILDQHGELLIGAADMGLYERVQASDLLPILPRKLRNVVVDANFPAETLLAVAQSLPDTAQLFAAGTSVEKVNRLCPVMARLDALVLNRAEAGKLTGADDGVAALAGSLSTKLQRPDACILVSDGADLAALASGGEIVVCQPPEIELKNANGAGDAMAAAFFRTCLDRSCAENDTFAGNRNLAVLLKLALVAGAAHAAVGRNV